MTQPPLCLSESDPADHYRPDFIAWAKAQPRALGLIAFLSVMRFVQERFPCPGAPAGRCT